MSLKMERPKHYCWYLATHTIHASTSPTLPRHPRKHVTWATHTSTNSTSLLKTSSYFLILKSKECSLFNLIAMSFICCFQLRVSSTLSSILSLRYLSFNRTILSKLHFLDLKMAISVLFLAFREILLALGQLTRNSMEYHREKLPSNKTPVLKKSMNMDI